MLRARGAAARPRRGTIDVEVCEGRVLRRAAAAPEQNRRPDRDSGAAQWRGPTALSHCTSMQECRQDVGCTVPRYAAADAAASQHRRCCCRCCLYRRREQQRHDHGASPCSQEYDEAAVRRTSNPGRTHGRMHGPMPASACSHGCPPAVTWLCIACMPASGSRHAPHRS
jgi:hypothetical protein